MPGVSTKERENGKWESGNLVSDFFARLGTFVCATGRNIGNESGDPVIKVSGI